MFPYPFINHMDMRNYTIGDVIARFKFMNGITFYILWVGTHGPPAENMQKKTSYIQKMTEKNISEMKRQSSLWVYNRLGFRNFYM